MAYSLYEWLVYEIDEHSEFWHRRLYFGRMYVCKYVEKKYSQRTPVKCICRKKCILEVYAHTYVRTEVSEGVDLNQYSIYQTVFYPQ